MRSTFLLKEPARALPAKANRFPSGEINWLLDVIAPDRATVATVIANFRKVVKEGDLRLHPLIARLVDPAVLEKMGAQKATVGTAESAAPEPQPAT